MEISLFAMFSRPKPTKCIVVHSKKCCCSLVSFLVKVRDIFPHDHLTPAVFYNWTVLNWLQIDVHHAASKLQIRASLDTQLKVGICPTFYIFPSRQYPIYQNYKLKMEKKPKHGENWSITSFLQRHNFVYERV